MVPQVLPAVGHWHRCSRRSARWRDPHHQRPIPAHVCPPTFRTVLEQNRPTSSQPSASAGCSFGPDRFFGSAQTRCTKRQSPQKITICPCRANLSRADVASWQVLHERVTTVVPNPMRPRPQGDTSTCRPAAGISTADIMILPPAQDEKAIRSKPLVDSCCEAQIHLNIDARVIEELVSIST